MPPAVQFKAVKPFRALKTSGSKLWPDKGSVVSAVVPVLPWFERSGAFCCCAKELSKLHAYRA